MMPFASYTTGQLHDNGDCWPPSCPACMDLDALEDDPSDDEEADE